MFRNWGVRIWFLSVALLASILLGACSVQQDESPTIQAIQERGVLRVGANVAPPWMMQDPGTGEWIGAGSDWAKELADELGVEVEFVETDWGLFVTALQTDKIDLTATALWETPERNEVIDFVTWSQSGMCYLVLKDNEQLTSLDDFDDPSVTIGTWTGSGGESIVKEEFANATIESVAQPPGQVERLIDVFAGRIDVTFIDSGLAPAYESEFPQIKILPGGGEGCATNPHRGTAIGAGIAKGDADWKAHVQDFIDARADQIQANLLRYSTEEYLLVGTE
jgi:polar amino acid transport system substrate-binding protein